MKRQNVGVNNYSKWFSEDTDWESNGFSIAIWSGTIVDESEYNDVKEFFLEETGSDVEPIGSFVDNNGIIHFVFLVENNIGAFSIKRFQIGGIRWWYDFFAEVNGGACIKEEEFLPIIEKLNLVINN